jgi:hypothetical protein
MPSRAVCYHAEKECRIIFSKASLRETFDTKATIARAAACLEAHRERFDSARERMKRDRSVRRKNLAIRSLKTDVADTIAFKVQIAAIAARTVAVITLVPH